MRKAAKNGRLSGVHAFEGYSTESYVTQWQLIARGSDHALHANALSRKQTRGYKATWLNLSTHHSQLGLRTLHW